MFIHVYAHICNEYTPHKNMYITHTQIFKGHTRGRENTSVSVFQLTNLGTHTVPKLIAFQFSLHHQHLFKINKITFQRLLALQSLSVASPESSPASALCPLSEQRRCRWVFSAWQVGPAIICFLYDRETFWVLILSTSVLPDRWGMGRIFHTDGSELGGGNSADFFLCDFISAVIIHP